MTHCPNCQALLPEPPERYCPSCGADLELVPTSPPPLPASTWAPAGGAREGIPWERRDRIGFVAALVETTQRVLTAPADFFREMPTTGGIASPLLYAVILGYAGIVVNAIYDFVLTTVMGTSFGSLSGLGGDNEAMGRLMPFISGGVGLGFQLILGPVFLVVGLFLVSGIVHLALMALGGGGRGFEATFRVASYSEAAAVFYIIPICGQLLGGIYMIVLMIIGVSEAHGISRGKAAAAVLLPILLCCCCITAPMVFFAMSMASQMQ